MQTYFKVTATVYLKEELHIETRKTEKRWVTTTVRGIVDTYGLENVVHIVIVEDDDKGRTPTS